MLLGNARLKINRANHHIADIKKRIALLHETDTARVEINPETGGEILEHTFSDETAFADLALMIGDAIHNLNCALDYTWLQTIQRLVPSLVNSRAKFPVHKTVEELKGSMTKAGIDSASPNLFKFMVDTIKPHSGVENAIWPVHCFDIRDKHRLLIPVLSKGRITGIVVVDEHGISWPGRGSSLNLQLPPYVIRYVKGVHVKEKGHLTADIIIEDQKSGYSLHVPDTLVAYSYYILRVIESFEDFLA